MKIAITGNGYVLLSNDITIFQYSLVVRLDFVREEVAMLNQKQLLIKDSKIHNAHKLKRLGFHSTLDCRKLMSAPTKSRSSIRPNVTSKLTI